MDRFEFREAKLIDGETCLIREKGVKLYNGDDKTQFENGELMLTSHRLVWSHAGDSSAGPTCLSLSLSYIVFAEEDNGGFGFSRTCKVTLYLAEPRQDKLPGPFSESAHNFIKLAFKEGMENNFMHVLFDALQSKKWEAPMQQHRNIKLRTGIVGIERGIQEKQKATDESISAAFQDLSKLMVMAKDMVGLSKTISQKIKEKQGDITEDETVRFKSYLLSLGIEDPVTRDSCHSESQYHQGLARELAQVLEEPIKIEEKESITAEELAQYLGISIMLAKERLRTTENHGQACRDETLEGLRFYPNLFLQNV